MSAKEREKEKDRVPSGGYSPEATRSFFTSDPLSAKVFQAAFDSGAFVGQMRTRLGIAGYETLGPQEPAKAMFKLIAGKRTGDGKTVQS